MRCRDYIYFGNSPTSDYQRFKTPKFSSLKCSMFGHKITVTNSHDHFFYFFYFFGLAENPDRVDFLTNSTFSTLLTLLLSLMRV